MIRAARSRHRVMVVGLALVVPVLTVAGLMLRQSIPVTDGTFPRGAASGGESYEMLGEQTVGEELPIRVSWLREPGSRERRAVALTLEGPLERPDLLVYWDDGPGDGSALSEAAWLLGRVGGRREVVWKVPEPVTAGRLVFYSTAWKAVVGSVSPPATWTGVP
jgi:hypothetical protein